MPARKPVRDGITSKAVSSKAELRPQFAPAVVIWQKSHGRHDLPWQHERSAYRVWLSEVMLQQTQVATVIPYFAQFTSRFADVTALADADIDLVMQLWSGLGYYSRARNLHRCAQTVRDQHDGQFPSDMEALQALPGIGRSTAAAISVFAFGQRQAILDGNVKRVFCQYFGVTEPVDKSATIAALWELADCHLPETGLVAYTQGLMDLGATCCKRSKPDCEHCPLRADCFAHQHQCTAGLPARSRKKPTPQRAVTMLVIVDAASSSVLVRKRPASGIWGGLFSLPESSLPVDEATDHHLSTVMPFAVNEVGGPARQGTPLTPVEHAFTHFKLTINPLLITDQDLAQTIQGQPDAADQWLALSEVATAALPAPVKSLLQGLAGQGKPGSNHLLFDQIIHHD